ncbi:hypothetical protein LTR85_004559 [Meristemomyces frigidus]|nr:hypothetical protein LTR85_004559 [Meristemomyces frigidus]
MARWASLTLSLLLLLGLGPGGCYLHTTGLQSEAAHDGQLTLPLPLLNHTIGGSSHYHLDNITDGVLDKRWYGIRDAPNPGPAYVWPTLGEIDPGCGKYHAGSPDAHLRPIRFCYATQATATRLFSLMSHAIARWGPAMQYSTMRIQHDTGCDTNYCICGAHTRFDALVITDGLVGGVGERALTDTTVGYNPDPAGKNLMNFGQLLEEPSTAPVTLIQVVTLVHELGHAIGLMHEHQRPDAVSHGWLEPIRYQNLVGYGAAMQNPALMRDNNPAFHPGMSASDRMQVVCQNWQLAQTYFPIATQWMSGDLAVPGRVLFQQSPFYDYSSMMHYSSHTGSPPNGLNVLLRGAGTLRPGQDQRVYMGGAQTFGQKAISAMDVARVAQLYPLNDQLTRAAAALEGSGGWRQMDVMVEGWTTTVYPAASLLFLLGSILPHMSTATQDYTNNRRLDEPIQAPPFPWMNDSLTLLDPEDQIFIDETNANLSKRWMSIPLAVPQGNYANIRRPWPTMASVYPGCANSPIAHEHWLRYCFVDERSANTLLLVVVHAIARWWPASMYSLLKIQPDWGCRGDYRCVCGPYTAPDALRIQDGRTANGQTEFITLTGIGYAPAGRYTNGAVWYRNRMVFSWLNPNGYDAASGGTISTDPFIEEVIMMTHELGYPHAVQNPALMADTSFPRGMGAVDRMTRVCNSEPLAQKYFSPALDFMSLAARTYDYSYLVSSPQYDYKSIMHYSSDDASNAPPHQGFALVKHPARVPSPPAGQEPDYKIWMGGRQRMDERAISNLDVARVAGLYPLSQRATQAAQNLEANGGWRAVPFVIPGFFTTTVYPAPTP